MSSNTEHRKPPGSKPGARPYAPKTDEIRDKFLENLRAGHTAKAAAEMAGTARRTVSRWRAEDEEFAKAWDEAYDEGTEVFEQEARRRAVDGVDRPVFQGGVLVGHVREYSDTLMTLKLHGRAPHRYNRNKLELTGPDGGPVTIKAEVEFVETGKGKK